MRMKIIIWTKYDKGTLIKPNFVLQFDACALEIFDDNIEMYKYDGLWRYDVGEHSVFIGLMDLAPISCCKIFHLGYLFYTDQLLYNV